jgi:hypothetical protein
MKTLLTAIMLVFFFELSYCSVKQASSLSLIQKSQVHLHELKIELSNLTVNNHTKNVTHLINNPANFSSNATHSKPTKKHLHLEESVVSNVATLNTTIDVHSKQSAKICEEVKVVSDIVSEVDSMVGELTDAFNDHIANLIQGKKSAVTTVDRKRWESYATTIVDYFITKTNDLREIIDDVSNAVKEVRRKECVSSSVVAKNSVTAFLERIQTAASQIGLGTDYVQIKLREINSKSTFNLRKSNKLKN